MIRHPSFLLPGPEVRALRAQALAVDIREAVEREGASAEILAMPHVPRAEWHTIPERFPQRPLVLCCAAGVRTRMCVEMLSFPEGVYAWVAPIQAWVEG